MSLPTRFGRYEVVEVLGQGAMGMVYKARDPVIDRQVAVKVVQANPGLGHDDLERLQARFEREFRSAGGLSHPNIVTVFDVGKEDHVYYVAMEYVVGQTLDAVLGTQRVLRPTDVADLATQLAGALDYAHAEGVVHRDVKPANVLVTEDGEAKITDFGLAKLGAGSLTQTGTLVGTPAYMSPEQVNGAPITGASDQFSLATMLYRMLTGERPFAADTPSTILYKVVHESPIAPQRLNRTLPDAVGDVLLRGLDKDPGRRFPTCTALAEALRAALQLDPDETVVTDDGPNLAVVKANAVASSQPSSGSKRYSSMTSGSDASSAHRNDERGTAEPPVVTASPAGLAFLVALVGLPTLALMVTLWFLLGGRLDEAGSASPPGNPGAAVTGEPGERLPEDRAAVTDSSADEPSADGSSGETDRDVQEGLNAADAPRRVPAGGGKDAPGVDTASAGTSDRVEFSLFDRLDVAPQVRRFVGEGQIVLEGGIPVMVEISRANPTLDDQVPVGVRPRLRQLVARLREAWGGQRNERDRAPRLPVAPVHALELPPGHYALHAVQPRLYFRQLHEVDLRRGDEVRIPLPRGAAQVTLDTDRSGGRVSMVNGIPADVGGRRQTLSLPAEVVLALGPNLVEIEWPGAGKREVRIEVERQGQRILLTPGR